MSIQQLLQQVMQSGQSLLQDGGSRINQAAPGVSSKFGGFGGGALTGGALGLLLGNKKFRKMGGKFASYGGAAALGALALKTYQDWQRNSSQTTNATATPVPMPMPPGGPLPALPEAELETHSRIILAAMIAAAKADGHIGQAEQQLLDAEVAKLANQPADLAWFEGELAKPVDPARAAELASTPEQAAEVYLSSLMVIDEQSYMERAYLDELARRLSLPDGLKSELEAKVRSLA